MFLSPVTALLIAALIGLLWSKGRFARTGRAIALAAILVLIVAAMTPLGLILVSPLEDRFPEPPADLPPPAGIIVLGGAVNGPVSKARGEIVFDEGERMSRSGVSRQALPSGQSGFHRRKRLVDCASRRRRWPLESFSSSTASIRPASLWRTSRATRRRMRSSPLRLCAPNPAAVAAGHLGLSYAPCDWGVRESRIRRGRRSGCLSNAWTGKRVAMGLGPWKQIHGFSRPRCTNRSASVYRATGRIDRLFPGTRPPEANYAANMKNCFVFCQRTQFAGPPRLLAPCEVDCIRRVV